ncbi:DNA-binding response regulator [Mariniphaga sediminis]|jgi:DNA-binding NarL/FixJ family response regulator|uniref:DNA-binding response regulator n=1 Tax=Mariniphaga sediminis TaxID=1628158 RepID=A0A399D1J7_9BACT|nr:response regulator transcription factor [Mariniphaga sediminis]RIH65754.1 DNA-binding response regulator [Mariniphaga sediminis]
MRKLKICLVDDHSLFREGLHFLLSNLDFIDEIYEAENGEQFISTLKQQPVDIVLLDIEMPLMNGIDAAKQALKMWPDIKIIALSMYSDENYYSSMIDAGAYGFLLKNSNFSEVRKAILDVWEGKNYFSTEIMQSILLRLNRKTQGEPFDDLTEREIEILYHICKGLSNAEIADILSISKRTVDKHRENLLQKTQSKNTANLVIFAIKHGYFSI